MLDTPHRTRRNAPATRQACVPPDPGALKKTIIVSLYSRPLARSHIHTSAAAVATHMPFTEVGTSTKAIAETIKPSIINARYNGRTLRVLWFDASLGLRLDLAIIAPCHQQP
jgi:hypothetical protein